MDFLQSAISSATEGEKKEENAAGGIGSYEVGGVSLTEAAGYVHQASTAIDKVLENDFVKNSGYADEIQKVDDALDFADSKLSSFLPGGDKPAEAAPAEAAPAAEKPAEPAAPAAAEPAAPAAAEPAQPAPAKE